MCSLALGQRRGSHLGACLNAKSRPVPCHLCQKLLGRGGNPGHNKPSVQMRGWGPLCHQRGQGPLSFRLDSQLDTGCRNGRSLSSEEACNPDSFKKQDFKTLLTKLEYFRHYVSRSNRYSLWADHLHIAVPLLIWFSEIRTAGLFPK